MTKDVMSALGRDFWSTSPLTRAIVGTYVFGMIQAFGMRHHQHPSDVHALVIHAFQEGFGYTPENALIASASCIDATAPDGHDTMKAILHRGIDGFFWYESGDKDTVSADLTSVLKALNAA